MIVTSKCLICHTSASYDLISKATRQGVNLAKLFVLYLELPSRGVSC